MHNAFIKYENSWTISILVEQNENLTNKLMVLKYSSAKMWICSEKSRDKTIISGMTIN